ncbi:MAG: hypothetical protein WBO97_00375 [Tepidiformaceae bacterium]
MTSKRPLLVLAAGVLVIALGVVGGFLVFGNNDDTPGVSGVVKEKTPSASTSGTVGGPDQVIAMPANAASITLEELPPNYEVDVPQTFAMTVSTFSSSYWFTSDKEGNEKAKEWKILDGFQVYYQPTGLVAEVLTGSPYIHVETYKFASVDGAKDAWAHFNGFVSRTNGSEPVEAKPLANDSSAYRFIQGTVSVSDTVAVFHRYSFRRGNFIVTVVTWGGENYMNIDAARNIAARIDDKLLGKSPATEPTPIPTPNFNGLGSR